MSIAVLETVTPDIDFDGQLGFCEGGSVILSGPEDGTYAWNVGVEAQSIEVSNSGEFQLDFTDVCGNTATSEVSRRSTCTASRRTDHRGLHH